MPYIREDDRERIDCWGLPTDAGELNYLISSTIIEYLGDSVSYSKINEVVGVLECAKLELYRRLAAPYEDKKAAKNGDIYKEEKSKTPVLIDPLLAKRKKIRIMRCNDPSLWYAEHIGKKFEYLGTFGNEHATREPAGFVNYVKVQDAFIE